VYGPGGKQKVNDWFAGSEFALAKDKAVLFLDQHYSAETITQIKDFFCGC
jgi:hypothetical protein